MREGVPERERIAGDMLYPGSVHILAGAPDTGKTTLSLSWALEVIRSGEQVMFLDEEGGRGIVLDRLKSLGATDKECESLAYYPFPGRSKEQWTRAGWADLKAELTEVQPALVLVDSAAAVLAAAGLDENSAADTALLWHAFKWMARSQFGAAVIVIDHVTKNAEDSRYSRGSGAKVADSDVMYRVDLIKPFSRQDDGVVKLVVTKDREGYLKRHTRLEVLRGPLRFEPADADESSPEPQRFQPTVYMERVAAVLAANQELPGWKPMSKNQLEKAVDGRAQYKRDALAELLTQGYVEATAGSYGTVYKLTRPYSTTTSSNLVQPRPDEPDDPRPTSSRPYRGTRVDGTTLGEPLNGSQRDEVRELDHLFGEGGSPLAASKGRRPDDRPAATFAEIEQLLSAADPQTTERSV